MPNSHPQVEEAKRLISEAGQPDTMLEHYAAAGACAALATAELLDRLDQKLDALVAPDPQRGIGSDELALKTVER